MSAPTTPLLEIVSLTKRFGGVTAVDGVTLAVPRGQVVGLIGPNGSGKSTLMNCVNGLERPEAGAIRLWGREITGLPRHVIARQGVGRTFQVPRVFPRLTAVENLLLALPAATAQDEGAVARAYEALAQVGLATHGAALAEELSGGQQKLLELAGIALRGADVLLLDEPFAGVHPMLCEVLIEVISGLVQQGRGALLVSHDLTSIHRLCRFVVVLSGGRRLAGGTPEAIARDPAVIDAYLGSDDEW